MGLECGTVSDSEAVFGEFARRIELASQQKHISRRTFPLPKRMGGFEAVFGLPRRRGSGQMPRAAAWTEIKIRPENRL